ncbi:MAG TPA: serine/threonine-protein kinase, partial [Nannocystaceae bacterium]|nr:serine/threonine-protein kinase [Nannocystaceae bacterium]
IGAGAMGVVYSAYDPDLDRRVAVKLLAQANTTGIERMIREAQAAAKVVHPNVVAVHDVGAYGARSSASTMFVAMELVDGENLGAWLRREPRAWREVIAMLVQAGRGLAAAHAAGIVHRDFKPDNVLVGKDGRARVADFGLARAIDREPEAQEHSGGRMPSTLSSGSIQLTATGALLGTPAYMAPEQHLRLACDARTDQFSFCIATWEALWGKRPFGGETLQALAVAVTDGQLELPQDSHGVPQRIRNVLARGLATAPDDRFPNMDALLGALDDAARPRRYARWIAVGAIAAGVAGVAYANRSPPPVDPCATVPIDASWNPTAREQLTAGFVATGTPFAADVARSIGTRLDDHHDRWSAQWREICRGLAEGAQQDAARVGLERRRECLDDRRRELDAALELLQSADAALVEHAFDVLGGVRDPDRCSDEQALRHRLDPPPADLLVEVAELRTTIERADVLNRAGHVREAEAMLAELEPRVQATGWAPMGVELEAARARLARSDTAPRVEVPRLRAAFDRALEIGNDLQAAEFAGELGWQLGYRDREYDEALQWLATSNALLRRTGGDWLIELRVVNNEAVINANRGEYDRAEELFARGLDLATAHDPTGLRPLQLKANLAAYAGTRGQQARAVQLLTEAMAGYVVLLGESHPRVADLAGNLGLVYWRLGDVERAREELERAARIQDQSLPPEHPAREQVTSGLAEVLYLEGELARALPYYRNVDAIRSASYGAAAPRAVGWRVHMMRRWLELVPRPDDEIDRTLASCIEAADASTEKPLQLEAYALRIQAALARGRTPSDGDVHRVRELLVSADASPEQRLGAWSVVAELAADRNDAASGKEALAAIDELARADLRPRHEVAEDLLRAARAARRLDREPTRALVLAHRANDRLAAAGTDRTSLPARIAAALH